MGASEIWKFFVIGGRDSGQCGTFRFVRCLADTGHTKCSKSDSRWSFAHAALTYLTLHRTSLSLTHRYIILYAIDQVLLQYHDAYMYFSGFQFYVNTLPSSFPV